MINEQLLCITVVSELLRQYLVSICLSYSDRVINKLMDKDPFPIRDDIWWNKIENVTGNNTVHTTRERWRYARVRGPRGMLGSNARDLNRNSLH